jgi:hypothetical protein
LTVFANTRGTREQHYLSDFATTADPMIHPPGCTGIYADGKRSSRL